MTLVSLLTLATFSSTALTTKVFALDAIEAQTTSSAAKLTIQRQHNYQAFLNTAATLLSSCGPRNFDVRGMEVFFPVGQSNTFYVTQEGLHAFIQVRDGKLRRVWCGSFAGLSGAQPRTNGVNSFLNYQRRFTDGRRNATYQQQLGRLPSDRGELDAFVLLAGTSTNARVSGRGQVKCQREVRQGLGLNTPVITDPLLCS